MKIKGLKITVRDNDYIDFLSDFFNDTVECYNPETNQKHKWERSYMYCLGYPQAKFFGKEDSNSIKEYVELTKQLDDIKDKLFSSEGECLTFSEVKKYISLVRQNMNDYIDNSSYSNNTRIELKKSLEIEPIDSISLEWQNGEVIYWIFANQTVLIF